MPSDSLIHDFSIYISGRSTCDSRSHHTGHSARTETKSSGAWLLSRDIGLI